MYNSKHHFLESHKSPFITIANGILGEAGPHLAVDDKSERQPVEHLAEHVQHQPVVLGLDLLGMFELLYIYILQLRVSVVHTVLLPRRNV